MQVLEQIEYRVKAPIGENAVLAQSIQGDVLLYGGGIGRNAEEGMPLRDLAAVEQLYPVDGANFGRILREADRDVVAVCEDAIHMASQELGEELDPSIHINLTDHVSVLVKRLRKRESIANPIRIQTEILYKREYQVARMMVAHLESRLDLSIPEGEVGFIALHIHGARSEKRTSMAVQYAYLAKLVTQYLESEFEREVDKESLDYMRLVTHLRFAVERVTSGTPIQNLLLDQIREELDHSYRVAEKAARLLEAELHCRFPEDEIAFFALYVERLRNP